MKIKEICEKTGLTDRTIRYYIEEGLISPCYTENYLGRKSFDLSEENVRELNSIAVLRKFDFSVEEILSLLEAPQKSGRIIQEVRRRTKTATEQGEQALAVLSRLDSDRDYTVPALAEELAAYSESRAVREEVPQRSIGRTVLSILKAVLILFAVWAPFVSCAYEIVESLKRYRFPIVSGESIVITVLCLLPSVVLLVLSVSKKQIKPLLKKMLLVLCVWNALFVGVFSSCIVDGSRTTDIRNYRDFDADCLVGRDSLFQDLLPTWPSLDESAKYYYDYPSAYFNQYDVYAEWPIENEVSFDQEVRRARALFEGYGLSLPSGGYYHYKEVRTENFTCLIRYRDGYADGDPFYETKGDYSFVIFAYHDETNVVRYIACECQENYGARQPYYLQLDW